MQNTYQTLLVIHVISGFASLALFWVPVFTRKGGINHRRIGQYYVIGMWFVVITAFTMSIFAMAEGRHITASFLGYLALITGQPLWLGIATLKQKQKPSVAFFKALGLVELVIAIAAVGLLSIGIKYISTSMGPVMVVFGVLGVISIPSALQNLGFLAPKTRTTQTWLSEHMTELLTTGIAAHTAFLVFGASSFINSLISGPWAIIPWVAPTVIGFIGIRYAKKKYLKPNKERLVAA